MNRIGEAERHRHQAEECRAKAELMADEETRALYFRLAEAYEALADNQEEVEHNRQSFGDLASKMVNSGSGVGS